MSAGILSTTEFDHHIGIGNWRAYTIPVERMLEAAEEWRTTLKGVALPWLCWHVNPRWSILQQRLVQHVGWTPVVGFDPRFGEPQAIPGAIVIDFNARFGFPLLYPHFALEFAFAFTERLAFWHSDLLCRLERMDELAQIFSHLPDGEMAAPMESGGRRDLLNLKRRRYWELACCTTKGASRSQFEYGAGWWQEFWNHPNTPSDQERNRRSKYYWDHGGGIYYWAKHCGGKVHKLDRDMLEEGHCTSINYPQYVRLAPINQKFLGKELDLNFALDEVAAQLGIAHLLP